MVLKHLWCPGKCHGWAQLGTGMGFSLLALPEKAVPHLECKLTESIRSGLTSIGARIESKESFVSLPRHASDSHIMDGVVETKHFNKSQLNKINACRLYMQATLVSDITTPCGRQIHPAYYEGKRSRRINWPTIQYPRQAKPDQPSWALWRKGLQLSLLRDDRKP
jgi:hypothetical protein